MDVDLWCVSVLVAFMISVCQCCLRMFTTGKAWSTTQGGGRKAFAAGEDWEVQGLSFLVNIIIWGMDQYLLIPFLGGYSHPFTSYFDVHQGYKVLTHCHIVLKHCSLASLLHIDHIDSYSRSCWMCSGASTSDTSWGRSWSESQRAWTTNQRATPGVELLCAHSLEGLCFRVAVQVLN